MAKAGSDKLTRYVFLPEVIDFRFIVLRCGARFGF
jgi:hypothetical protein